MNRYAALLCAVMCVITYTCPARAGADLPRPWIWTLTESGGWLCEIWLQDGVPAEAYVWVSPDSAGIFCVEYQVVFNAFCDFPPYNITLQYSSPNPAASSVTGTPVDPPGTVICFDECRTDGFWAHKLVFMPSSHGALIYLDIAPHDDSGEVRAVSCTEPGNPYISLNHWVWDWTGGIGGLCPGVEETSWGAIKSMFNEGGK